MSERNFQQVIEGWRSNRSYVMYGVRCADEASAIRERLVGLLTRIRADRKDTYVVSGGKHVLTYSEIADFLEQILGHE